MEGCVFCDIVEGKRDAHVLYEDSHHMAFLDRYPVVPGHSLVIPKSHHTTILEMEPQQAGTLFALVPVLAPAILDATGTVAFNVGQNNGDAAKQVVPHVHIHIIPRRHDDRINWSVRATPNHAQLDRMADGVREYLRTRLGLEGCHKLRDA